MLLTPANFNAPPARSKVAASFALIMGGLVDGPFDDAKPDISPKKKRTLHNACATVLSLFGIHLS